MIRLISELKSIPDDTVRAIYRQRYFKPSMCTAFTAPLALMHFDAAVNHGVSAAIQMLQGVARVTVDGEIGPETLSAIGSRSVVDLIDDYAEVRRSRYRALPALLALRPRLAETRRCNFGARPSVGRRRGYEPRAAGAGANRKRRTRNGQWNDRRDGNR